MHTTIPNHAVTLSLSLTQLFEGAPAISTAMLENGLIETLCNVLSALCSHLPKQSMMQPGWAIVVNDVQHFMACVANKIYR